MILEVVTKGGTLSRMEVSALRSVDGVPYGQPIPPVTEEILARLKAVELGLALVAETVFGDEIERVAEKENHPPENQTQPSTGG